MPVVINSVHAILGNIEMGNVRNEKSDLSQEALTVTKQ